jgi:predicted lipoprotein with Yx(FWY)xxD motif
MRFGLRKVALASAIAVAAALPTSALAGGSRVIVKVGKLADQSHTSVLVNKFGRTLYMSAGDQHRRSNCYGDCTAVWKPVMATGPVVAGSGANKKLLGTTRRKNGKRQVTYNHHPLYLYIAAAESVGAYDGQGCDVTGSPVQPGETAIWRALSARGTAIKHILPYNACESGY